MSIFALVFCAGGGRSYAENYSCTKILRIFHYVSYFSFIDSGPIFRFCSIVSWFGDSLRHGDQVSSFCTWIHNFLTPFVKEATLPPNDGFGTFIKNQLSVDNRCSFSKICILFPQPVCLFSANARPFLKSVSVVLSAQTLGWWQT